MVVNIKSSETKTTCHKCKKQVLSSVKRSKGWKYSHFLQHWYCKACIYRMRGQVSAV